MKPKIHILGFDILQRVSTFQYEVWVFRRDLKRARAVIAAVPAGWFDRA